MTDKQIEPVVYDADDFRIVLTSNSYKFRVEGEAMQWPEAFDSFDAAMSHIESRRKIEVKAQREKISEAALTKDGKPVTITGLHSGHGKLLCSDKEYTGSDFYPDVPSVRSAVEEMVSLRRRITALDAKLGKVRIRREFSFGRVETAEHYNRIVEKFRSDWAKALANAEELQEST